MVSKIGPGLVALVGILDADSEPQMDYIIKKTLHLKLWPSEDGKPWTRSCLDMGYEVLVVSQFTLPICFKKGSLTSNNANRPDFHFSMAPAPAELMYERMLEQYRTEYSPDKVLAGTFAAMMEVSLVNDGPVTIPLGSSQPLLKAPAGWSFWAQINQLDVKKAIHVFGDSKIANNVPEILNLGLKSLQSDCNANSPID